MPLVNSLLKPQKPVDSLVYLVHKFGKEREVNVLQRRTGEAYVHYLEMDKRMDEWVSDAALGESPAQPHVQQIAGRASKRKRVSNGLQGLGLTLVANGAANIRSEPTLTEEPSIPLTEEEIDIQHHRQITAQRNFDKVIFGQWQIRTWYYSPYPLSENEPEEAPLTPIPSSSSISTTNNATKIPGVSRATMRSHSRTSDLLAGGLGRVNASIEKSVLWVCDRCFKYMSDGQSWELHTRNCTRKHPPGRKVYQRGAHIVWEVDGAKDKLYCQNLSLFGKLFIDVKTLFFDCDNFLFYLLTDADSQRDHVIGFFSKEKISYDDYNLACIITLPPYQRKNYGMLMIEFSYELSRRSGRVGTPERPLSDLGLRSYLTYWVSTLVRFLRRLLSVVPPEAPKVTRTNGHLRTPSVESDGAFRPKKKRMKGWDGEAVGLNVAMAPLGAMDDPIFTTNRVVETVSNADGSATSHVIVKCKLEDIARASNLRVEDTAFALNECGLISRKILDVDDGEDPETIAISREMVEHVAKEWGVKKAMMDMAHVLL